VRLTVQPSLVRSLWEIYIGKFTQLNDFEGFIAKLSSASKYYEVPTFRFLPACLVVLYVGTTRPDGMPPVHPSLMQGLVYIL
jgi:hypothetical protein